MVYASLFGILGLLLLIAHAQQTRRGDDTNLKMLARWCCVNEKEFEKCNDWKLALNRTTENVNILLDCVLADDKYECFKRIFEDQSDLMVADAGEIYTAGKYYNLVPLATEIYALNGGANTQITYSDHYSVAVVRKSSQMTMDKLKGSNSCHDGVGTSSGWNIPISTLIEKKLLEIVDCNNHVKAATKFFNKMCAPDALNNQFNPTGDNPTSACDLCRGRIGSTFCTNQDPYAGNLGAMTCLIEGGGDVAFVKHTTLQELRMINRTLDLSEYELLCPQTGRTDSIDNYLQCNWGKSPGRAVLTSGRKANLQKNNYREFLRQSAQLFADNPPLGMNSSGFKLFDSMAYSSRNLLFLDETVQFEDLENGITYLSFLNSKSPDYLSKILKLYECPLRMVRLCVISNFEKDKCRLMKNAFASRNIKPDLDCVSGRNSFECMSMIKNRLADMITLDTADAYRASRYFDMKPLAAEDYGTLTEKPIYYAVAVVKKTDLTTNLWNLRNKRACGSAIGDMAGWHVPVDYLIGIKEFYVTDCSVNKVAGEYFGRSCVPGSLDYDFNTLKTNPRALCLACYSKGADYCARNQKEYFYGDTGAFRCINEGLGDIGFVRHTSVKSNTDGRNTDQWARPLRQTDFELLCKDGTRKSVEKYEECNLMKVPSRIVMVAGHRSDIQRSYIWNMLNFAQQLFGSDTNPDFNMFESMKEHPDLIFLDATVQLIEINEELNDYLGNDLINVIHRTDDRICNSATNLIFKMTTILLLILIPFF